jgi:hypothetical protein
MRGSSDLPVGRGEMPEWVGTAVAILGCALLMLTSGRLVNGILRGIAKEDVEAKLEKRVRDTGVVVGKCENILIVVFVLVGAYTALSVLFAGKALVRREDMSKNSLYFLAGTMVNVTYSLLVALLIKAAVARL